MNVADEYNALPERTRILARATSNRLLVNQLEQEKKRLAARTAQSLREINDHIKNLESFISKDCEYLSRKDSDHA